MPAFTSRSVGSSATRLAEGTTVCPRSSKKRRKRRAISADSISAAILYVVDSVLAGGCAINAVDPEPGAQLGFPARRYAADVVGEVPDLVGRSTGHVVGPQ